MKKNYLSLLALLLATIVSTGFTSCGDEDDDVYSYTTEKETRISKPTISLLTSALAYSTFEIIFKVVSDEEPTGCAIYYGESSTKTDNPRLNKSSSCRLYSHPRNSNTWYYKSQHAGFHEGFYLYFYGETANSAGEAKTPIKWDIFKRTYH